MACCPNTRCLDILSLLLDVEGPLPSTEIAGCLKITPRMVRSSLIAVEPWLKEQNIALVRMQGKGISLDGSASAKKRLALSLKENEQPPLWLSSEEQLYVLLFSLLLSDQPQQVKQFQQLLETSRTTGLKLLDQAQVWLQTHRLELIRRPNYGFKAAGEESLLREALLCLLQESAGDARLLALCQGLKTVVHLPYRNKSGLEKVLLDLWAELEVQAVKRIISPGEHLLDGLVGDQAYLELLLYTAICVYRNLKEKSVESAVLDDSSNLHPQQLEEAHRIASQIQARFGVHFSTSETLSIGIRIPVFNFKTQPQSWIGAEVGEETATSVLEIVGQVIGQAGRYLHPGLQVDPDLNRNLSLYLETLLDPLRSRLPPDSSLVTGVKKQYPYIFSVAEQSSQVVAKRLGRELTQAEIGDIAMCYIAAMERLCLRERQTFKVLVVCSAGVITSWLLFSRLQAEFSEIEIIQSTSAFEVEQRKTFDGIDFIVSTIPLKMNNIPCVQVSPLLGEKDRKKIRSFLENKKKVLSELKAPVLGCVHLSDLIVPETIMLGLQARCWQEVVDQAGALLLEAGYIEASFIQEMKEIIEQRGPYMVLWPGVALLHAHPWGVRRLCMDLITLREPVFFGHAENDPVGMVVVLGAVDHRAHLAALRELHRMMLDGKARSAIQKALHKATVLKWVSKYGKSS